MLAVQYRQVRQQTEAICAKLEIEDYGLQPAVFVSPAKWHLAHTSWFFETFILKPELEGYQPFNPHYNFFYNSYYEAVGVRTLRAERGHLSRPTVAEVYAYRQYVDEHIERLLAQKGEAIQDLLTLGLNHEQQHQELLVTDLKYSLGLNPIFPAVLDVGEQQPETTPDAWIKIPAGFYHIGYEGTGFCFDNELARHQVWLPDYEISASLVTNKAYLAFVEAGGYREVQHWHQEGWAWVKATGAEAPLYWGQHEGQWYIYTLNGLDVLAPTAPVAHLNFYEASAYAAWAGCRLPTEFEWEAASPQLSTGLRWEWTNSAYLPYPGYQKAEGALGEYNGKFMINQMSLRGASVATPSGHSRPSYRNFFHPDAQWQFTGIRLAR